MPMNKQERDELRRRLSALKAAEEVESVVELLKKVPQGYEVVLRLTHNSDQWQQMNSRSAPDNAMWKRFAGGLMKALEEYKEELLAMARGEEEGVERLDAETGVE